MCKKRKKPQPFSNYNFVCSIYFSSDSQSLLNFSRINNYNKSDCSHLTILTMVSFKKALGLNLGICCVQSDMFDVEIPDSLKQHLGAKYTETL